MRTTSLGRIIGIGALIVCTTGASQAQTRTHAVRVEAGDMKGQPFTLEEMGALVVHKGDDIQVLFVMDPAMRPEAYRDIDLQADDRILMANGKKITSIDVLKEVVEGTEIGGQIQLGIKRDKDMLMVRYLKADPESLPKVKRMTVASDEDDGGEERTFISKEDGEERVSMLTGTGLIARETDRGVEIAYLLPHKKEHEGLGKVAEGDGLVSVQGKRVTSLDELDTAWDRIAIGETVTLVLTRNGEEYKAHCKKPDPSKLKGGAMMITK